MIDFLHIVPIDDVWGDGTEQFNYLYITTTYTAERYISGLGAWLNDAQQDRIQFLEERYSILGDQGIDFMFTSVPMKLINPQAGCERLFGWYTVNEDWQIIEKLKYGGQNFKMLATIYDFKFKRNEPFGSSTRTQDVGPSQSGF